jgi:homoserine O-acetyltransferase
MNNLSKVKSILVKKTLKLDCGKEISNFPLAYETYGRLNEKRDNAILVFHALTGDQFASGINPVTNKDGWWNYAVAETPPLFVSLYLFRCTRSGPPDGGSVLVLSSFVL